MFKFESRLVLFCTLILIGFSSATPLESSQSIELELPSEVSETLENDPSETETISRLLLSLLLHDDENKNENSSSEENWLNESKADSESRAKRSSNKKTFNPQTSILFKFFGQSILYFIII